MPITYNHLRDFLRPGTDELDRLNAQREAQKAQIVCYQGSGEGPLTVAWSNQTDVTNWGVMCGGDDSDGDTLILASSETCFPHSITLCGGTIGKSVSGGTGSSIRHDNSGWEGYYAMPYDAPAPVDNAAVAAKAEATERKGKSLMQAIGALQQQWKSNGKPHQFLVD